MKTTIERLTQGERVWLDTATDGHGVEQKALRIIDQLTAALEAAQDPDEWRVECQYFTTLFYSEKSRAEALQARVAELETQERNAGKLAVAHLERAMTAESELATAKARVAELEAAYEDALQRKESTLKDANASEHELGEAVELLRAITVEEDFALGRLKREAELFIARAAKHTRFNSAESELAALRGRVERALIDTAMNEARPLAEAHAVRCAVLEALRGR